MLFKCLVDQLQVGGCTWEASFAVRVVRRFICFNLRFLYYLVVGNCYTFSPLRASIVFRGPHPVNHLINYSREPRSRHFRVIFVEFRCHQQATDVRLRAFSFSITDNVVVCFHYFHYLQHFLGIFSTRKVLGCGIRQANM